MGHIESIYPELPFMAATISVLGLILSSSQYLRSAKARFPLVCYNGTVLMGLFLRVCSNDAVQTSLF